MIYADLRCRSPAVVTADADSYYLAWVCGNCEIQETAP